MQFEPIGFPLEEDMGVTVFAITETLLGNGCTDGGPSLSKEVTML